MAADEVTEEQIAEYAESIGYERISRREFRAPGQTAVSLGVMRRRAQEYFDTVEEESGVVHPPEETTAEQIVRFYAELTAAHAPMGAIVAILGGAAQGLVSQQGLILKEKEPHSE